MVNKPLQAHGLRALHIEWGLLSCGFHADRQLVVDTDRAEPYINAGYRFIGTLPNGRVVLERGDPNPQWVRVQYITAESDWNAYNIPTIFYNNHLPYPN